MKEVNTNARSRARSRQRCRLVYELYGLTEDEIKIVEGTD